MNDGLTGDIIGYAMKVHRELGPGFLEQVYQKALEHELSKAKLDFESQARIDVYYDTILVGEFIADIIVENTVIVELKAVENLIAAHEVQLVNYLNAVRIDTGLLLNFGGASLTFKRKFRQYKNPVNPV